MVCWSFLFQVSPGRTAIRARFLDVHGGREFKIGCTVVLIFGWSGVQPRSARKAGIWCEMQSRHGIITQI
jgi:hypothetical protein